ncbi:hypothetical protein [Oryza sativa Japonica Group]|uniref:Uncharacterized protein n=2 Tax=Oryza sativa subsp. japonica TaxID=39947 RepID=Q5QLA6_ORYSJ|nr:hypothetical protein [Oryza sativa Japonica Group]BAD73805.1 hypothetical protein [Oryza sativa Japonica Group]
MGANVAVSPARFRLPRSQLTLPDARNPLLPVKPVRRRSPEFFGRPLPPSPCGAACAAGLVARCCTPSTDPLPQFTQSKHRFHREPEIRRSSLCSGRSLRPLAATSRRAASSTAFAAQCSTPASALFSRSPAGTTVPSPSRDTASSRTYAAAIAVAASRRPHHQLHRAPPPLGHPSAPVGHRGSPPAAVSHRRAPRAASLPQALDFTVSEDRVREDQSSEDHLKKQGKSHIPLEHFEPNL